MNPTILIIDDEPHVAAAIQRLLRPGGYEIRVAHDGPTGLQLLADNDVAVLICDQRMPGMTGAHVLAESARVRPDAYRITLTGHADVQALQASVNEGHAQRLLFKPWQDDQVREAVQEGVRLHQLARENQQLLEITQQQAAELEEWNQRLAGEVEQRTRELEHQNRELLRLQRHMTESLHDVVNVLAAMIETSVPNAALHSKRIARLALLLGERLDLEAKVLRDVEFAARLHEIGWLGRRSPTPALATPAPRHRQASLERRRAAAGCAIVSHIRGFEQVAHTLQCLCERYDGSGVPAGLRGEDIPLAARIIAIADAYDTAAYAEVHAARVSDQAGRRALLSDHGQAFDPSLVELFLAALDAAGRANAGGQEAELSPGQLRAGMTLSRDLRNVHDLLVLRAGTCLTDKHVARIRAMSAADPMLSGVFVQCQPDGTDNDPPQAATPAKTAGAAVQPSGPAPRVLIVDDDDLVRRALMRELRAAGCEVACAQDGHEAQNILEDQRFDMLVVDVAMPLVNGTALVAHVQQCWPDQPCVVVTGHATREQIARLAQATNVLGVLAKPWDSDRLIGLVRAGIAKAQRHGHEDAAG